MKKVLPIRHNITKAWPEHNFLLSVIEEKDTAYDWIMNMYVQIYSSHFECGRIVDDRISFYPSGSFTVKANIYDLCPFIEKFIIDSQTIDEKWTSYANYLIDRINHNYYCSCMVDRFFMNNTGFFHPIYIVGYDLSREIFICYDNFEHRKYMMKEIGFEIFEKAYRLMLESYKEPYWDNSFSYKTKDYYYEFNIQLLKKLLLDYVEPRKNICYLNEFINIPSSRYRNSIVLGIDSYDLLISDIQSAYERKDALDWRSFSFLCDHKHIMSLRYKYLIEHNYIYKRDKMEMELLELEKEWTILQNKCIKYNFSRNEKLLREIENRVIILKNIDRDLIRELIFML